MAACAYQKGVPIATNKAAYDIARRSRNVKAFLSWPCVHTHASVGCPLSRTPPPPWSCHAWAPNPLAETPCTLVCSPHSFSKCFSKWPLRSTLFSAPQPGALHCMSARITTQCAPRTFTVCFSPLFGIYQFPALRASESLPDQPSWLQLGVGTC